jgi:hypothetical protein
MNRFIEHSQVVTTTKYNTVADFHTTNHSTLTYSVYFQQSSLSISWQRIYNTLTVDKYSNHTLSLHRPTYNSSLTQLFKLTASLLASYCSLLQPTADCKRPFFSLINLRRGPTENMSHVSYPAISLARCCLATSYKHLSYCCLRVSRGVYRAVA